MTDLRGKIAIVGAATKGSGIAPPGWTMMELAAQAAIEALGQANVRVDQVDGLFGAHMTRVLWLVEFAEYMGIAPSYVDGTQIGGAAFEAHCLSAAMALDAGLCDYALIIFSATTRSGRGPWPTLSEPTIYREPYIKDGIVTYAMAAARHMHDFGTTREQLAEVAVAARQWAAANPEAFMRDPLTVEDVIAARMISSPLGVRDCCLVTDGAAAIVLTRADRAKDHAARPAYMLGGGVAFSHVDPSQMRSLTTTVAKESGRRAFSMARVSATQVDALQLYDAFTINVLLFLEDLGFCPKGEGGRFIQGGRIAPGGALPVNTNGGGLSCVHPGMYGAFLLVETFRQISRNASGRQLERADVLIAHGNGGNLSTQATTIWGSEATL